MDKTKFLLGFLATKIPELEKLLKNYLSKENKTKKDKETINNLEGQIMAYEWVEALLEGGLISGTKIH